MAEGLAARGQTERADRHDLFAMQGDEFVRRAHKLHVLFGAGAAMHLIVHDFGNRQLGDGMRQCFLQAGGEIAAFDQALHKKRLALAVRAALEIGQAQMRQAHGGEFFLQRRAGHAVGRHGDRYRQDFFSYRLVGRARGHAGYRHGKAARGGVPVHRAGCVAGVFELLAHQLGQQLVGEGRAQGAQRLRGQFFGEQFNKQGGHGGARDSEGYRDFRQVFRRPAPACRQRRTSGSPDAHAHRNTPGRPDVTDCGCGRCRPRVRSPKWRRGRRAG